MTKLILIACSLLAANHFGLANLQTIPHLGDYAKVLLIALVFMPWVANQFDS